MKKFLCIIVVIILITLNGCSNKTVMVTDQLKNPINHCVYEYNGKINDKVLSIFNCNGDIKIIKSKNQNFKIKVDLIQTKKIKDLQEKLNNLIVKSKSENEVDFFEPVCKDNPNLNYWQWIFSKLNSNGIKINFYCEVPEKIKEIRVYNGIGNIYLNDLESKFYLQTNVGFIKGENIKTLNDTVFKVNVSDNKNAINIKFSNINDSNKIIAGANVGNIFIDIPSSSKNIHQINNLNKVNCEYPYEMYSKKYFEYCQKKCLEKPSPLIKETNEINLLTNINNDSLNKIHVNQY